jgi:hypothetical protein
VEGSSQAKFEILPGFWLDGLKKTIKICVTWCPALDSSWTHLKYKSKALCYSQFAKYVIKLIFFIFYSSKDQAKDSFQG